MHRLCDKALTLMLTMRLPSAIGGHLVAVLNARRLTYRFARASERWLPPSVAMHLIARTERWWGEPELRLLPLLASPQRLAVDIGAAEGLYSYFLQRHARECHAFEPNPKSAARLRRRVPNALVHAYALSDRHGELELRVPSVAGVVLNGWGTVEPANTFSALPPHEVATARVPCSTLDSLQLRNVGFMKIDVEGHELNVLEGARDTLKSCRPNLLVEAEVRHRPGAVRDVRNFLDKLEYRGWYFEDGALLPLDRLFARDAATSRYINNLIFTPAERCASGEALQVSAGLGLRRARHLHSSTTIGPS
jgi:FkbM family methyltransferase